jgi:O-antigen/teichoic acid export membrane protein
MPLSTVARNALASFAGKAWASVLSLVFIPLYVRLMGVETYGLVGIYVSLSALLSVLDLGLSSTLSRELARLTAVPSDEARGEARDLARTLELAFWAVGLIIALGLLALAPVLASSWITARGISEADVSRAVALMGLVIAIQWPTALYDGALTGLQRQVPLNTVRSVTALVQHGGAVLVLWLVSPTVLAYFAWQLVASAGQTVALRRVVWRALGPAGERGAFRPHLVRRHGWFAAGMSGISILTIVLTQADKIVLSKLLPLQVFGYYVLATNVASVLVQAVTPMFAALFPKFTQVLSGLAEGVDAATLYHASCQSVALLVLPAAAILALFPRELLLLWLHDPATAEAVAPLARLLVIGQALNALMFIPALAQMAFAWTRLILFSNLAAVAVLVPLMTLAVQRYGAMGGPLAWVALNAGYVLFMIPLMHRRLFRGEMWRWYAWDVGAPLAAALAAAALSRVAMPAALSPGPTFVWIAVTGAIALGATALAMPFTRGWISRQAASAL